MINKDLSILIQIKQFNLFGNCGMPFEGKELAFSISQIQNKEAVEKNIFSDNWSNFTLEARNTFNFYLRTYSRNKKQEEEVQQWNKLVRLYKQELTVEVLHLTGH